MDGTGAPVVRIGIDMVTVADVAASIAEHGERYLGRLFTGAEVAAASGADPVRAARLAGRLAVKEATLKALAVPLDDPPGWREIEVLTAASGQPRLVLHGRAATLAASAGLRGLSVSISHEGPLAVAVVVALGWP